MKNLIEKLKRIKPATYIRTAALILALANQICSQLGIIKFTGENQDVYGNMSWLITAVTGLIAWWKNNSFTDAAIKADNVLSEIREQKKE